MKNAVKIGANDNVATVITEVKSGSAIIFEDTLAEDSSIPAGETIPIYHKVAIHNIPKGQFVFKYGQIIGVATADIPAGHHAHCHNISSAPRKEV